MLKKMMMVTGMSVAVLLASGGLLMAGWGGDDGYDPLYWNGPAGFGDYNILFRPGGRYSKARFRLSNHHDCAGLLRKYRHSGKLRILRRFHHCRARY